jgi:hypothetical protein
MAMSDLIGAGDALDHRLGTLTALRVGVAGGVRPSDLAEALALTTALLPLRRRTALAWRHWRQHGPHYRRRRSN